MYKDDNMIGGCNNALLRMMLEGRGNSCPLCENKSSNQKEERLSPHEKFNHNNWGLSGYPLASVFAPLQEFDNLYDVDTALKQGTAFSDLYLPFTGSRRVSKGGNCRG